jgi:phosphoenolpyruvate phosphomutase
VIVPTKYFPTPTTLFEQLGISTVIWANHNLRASVTAMQNTCRQIMSEQSLLNTEGKVSKLQYCVTPFGAVRQTAAGHGLFIGSVSITLQPDTAFQH